MLHEIRLLKIEKIILVKGRMQRFKINKVQVNKIIKKNRTISTNLKNYKWS